MTESKTAAPRRQATGETPGSLAEALAAFQAKLPKIGKGETANVRSDKGNYSYKYADLADVSQAVMPLMGSLGLSFTAKPTLLEGQFVLVYTLRHVCGESDEGVYPLPSQGSPQQVGSAITYARRYCLCAATGVAPDSDDDDGVAAQETHRMSRSAGDAWENARPAPSRGQRAQQMESRPPLPDGDPWKAKIEELDSAASAADAEAELQELWQANQIGNDRANQILYAIRQRFPKDAQDGAPASGKPAAAVNAPQRPPADEHDTAADPVLQEWAAKIDRVTDYVTCLELHEELNAAEEAKQVTPHTAAGLRRAIEGKRATLNGGLMAQNATPRPSRPKGPSAEERGAKPVPTGKNDWLPGFRQRLAEAAPGQLDDLQKQVGPAVKARWITPAQSAELTKDIHARRRELEGANA